MKTSRRLGMSVVLFCRKSFSDFWGKAIKRLNRLAIQSFVYDVEGESDKAYALKKVQDKCSFVYLVFRMSDFVYICHPQCR